MSCKESSRHFAPTKKTTSKSILFRATAFLSQLVARFGMYGVSFYYNASGGAKVEVVILLLIVEMGTIVGTAINATRVPERFFPGAFDLFHSHTLFHIMTGLVLYSLRDIWMAQAMDAARYKSECTATADGTPLWAAASGFLFPFASPSMR